MALTILSGAAGAYRSDFTVDDNDLVDPTNADCLKAGEWVAITADQAVGRPSADGLATNDFIASGDLHGPYYPVFTQMGDTAAQALKKVTCVTGPYGLEMETDIYATETGSAYAIGCQLFLVGEVFTGGPSDPGRMVLAASTLGGTAATGDLCVAICTRIPSANNSKLRFQLVAPHYIEAPQT